MGSSLSSSSQPEPVECSEAPLVCATTVDELAAVPASAFETSRVVLHAIDLTGDRGGASRGLPVFSAPLARAVFLGCVLPASLRVRAAREGATIFPRLPDLPYRLFRGLYGGVELYEGFDEADEAAVWTDRRVYDHYQRTGAPGAGDVLEGVARALHDFSVRRALHEFVDEPGRRVAGIMGGHSLARTAEDYREVARLSRALTRSGYTVVHGGGPGAMEAASLGAFLAPHPDGALDDALAELGRVPTFRDGTHRWVASALAVRRRYLVDGGAGNGVSLAVPTYLYAHEPTTVFSSHVAKLFENSVREASLLAIATSGLVVAPGSAGTVMEVFADACEGVYGSVKDAAGQPIFSPMVFLNERFWTEELPVMPLLRRLAERARNPEFGQLLFCAGSGDEAVRLVEENDPMRDGRRPAFASPSPAPGSGEEQ